MSPGILVFLIGIYIVPIALLAWGHKVRRLTPRSRRGFWGAIIGHIAAGTIALVWGMIPPDAWTAEETAPGFFENTSQTEGVRPSSAAAPST